MTKNKLSHPVLVYMYGLPGSGKTFVGRQLSTMLGMVHLNSEQVRQVVTDKPTYSKEEQFKVRLLMNFMTARFLDTGISVVYDMPAYRTRERRALKEMATKHNAKDLLLWIQLDVDSAWDRLEARDKRTYDDKFAEELDQKTFEKITQMMQSPKDEKPVVLSGKHLFNSQKSTILRRLYEMGILVDETLIKKFAKPELINLVPRTPADNRADYARRNVVVR